MQDANAAKPGLIAADCDVYGARLERSAVAVEPGADDALDLDRGEGEEARRREEPAAGVAARWDDRELDHGVVVRGREASGSGAWAAASLLDARSLPARTLLPSPCLLLALLFTPFTAMPTAAFVPGLVAGMIIAGSLARSLTNPCSHYYQARSTPCS